MWGAAEVRGEEPRHSIEDDDIPYRAWPVQGKAVRKDEKKGDREKKT
jgi:hypothetical protein